MEAGVGSLVSIRFHGKLIRGWVLGPTDDLPTRMLKVHKVVSPIRFFDERLLELFRWVSNRYIAPLASVIARSHPPRVVSEETGDKRRLVAELGPSRRRTGPSHPAPPPPSLAGYRGGDRLLDNIRQGDGSAYRLRPIPELEQTTVVEAVGAALAANRTAVVLVPEADPLPATARALVEAFGDDVALFLGGDKRARYRMWLDIGSGQYRCVVGTRPAVFAPVAELGLIWISRESHAAHREERSPYYHVRDVALARAGIEGAVGVMAALCPSTEAAATAAQDVVPSRRSWLPVEVVAPGPEGRATRLMARLKEARRAFLFEPLPGYGVARVCRTCAEPASCTSCGGVLRLAGGSVKCAVCESPGRCSVCGGNRFGIARGGAERVEQWARGVAAVPVRRVTAETPSPGEEQGITVGGADAVRDLAPIALDLVGILDADLAARRPGLSSRERALAVWMEAVGWARPRGHVVVQTRHPGDPAIQSLVTGNPERFNRDELRRRQTAGFPAGSPVFRIAGVSDLPSRLGEQHPITLLASAAQDETVCLVAVRPDEVGSFGRAVRALAERGVVSRVEAEPHL
jgi:primosomal protein N' (replication factor Y)